MKFSRENCEYSIFTILNQFHIETNIETIKSFNKGRVKGSTYFKFNLQGIFSFFRVIVNKLLTITIFYLYYFILAS